MARRRNLKGIASGIASSFVSRNNDIDGYWALGLLCQLAKQLNRSCIVIELVGPTQSEPTAALVSQVGTNYSQMLARMLSRQGMESEWVRRAQISIEFGTSGALSAPPLNTWGGPFLCKVSITDDHGRVRSVSLTGRCGPHDPQKESRSTRAEGF